MAKLILGVLIILFILAVVFLLITNRKPSVCKLTFRTNESKYYYLVPVRDGPMVYLGEGPNSTVAVVDNNDFTSILRQWNGPYEFRIILSAVNGTQYAVYIDNQQVKYGIDPPVITSWTLQDGILSDIDKKYALYVDSTGEVKLSPYTKNFSSRWQTTS